MTIPTFEELIALDNPVPLDISNDHLRMRGTDVPLSIKTMERDEIYNTIVNNNLRSGFEIATGFGVSALYAGLGFKETNGRLISMDSYVEEVYNNAGTYEGKRPGTNKTSKGFQCANFLKDHYGLQDNIQFEIGWSPEDVPELLKDITLDYAFIDGGHFGKQILDDTKVLLPYLTDNCKIIYHDGYFPPDFIRELEELVGGRMRMLVPAPIGENLQVLER